MIILRFEQFINESRIINESGIPLYRGSNFNPIKNVKQSLLLSEIQDLLSQVLSGDLSEVTVLADIPTQGKGAPSYLKDLYSEMEISHEESGDEDEEDYEDDIYDPETGTYTKVDYEKKEKNIFVDSEFIVKDIDMTKGVIIVVPYSLKKKNITVELNPEQVEEIFIN